MGERPGGSVAAGERVAQGPVLPQCGDQGGVPVLGVEHLAFGDPRGDQDGGDPVARPVEGEPELAGRGGGVRRRHRGGRDVVVGARTRLLPDLVTGGFGHGR